MTRTAAIKQLETVIGKLTHIGYNIQGNSHQLQEAIRNVARVRDLLQSKQITTKKL